MALVVLTLAWRRGRLTRAAGGVIVALPLLALTLQVAWRLDLSLMGLERAARQANIEDYPGDRERRDVLVGALAGFEEHGDLSFRRYRFASLDGRSDRRLEIAVPPEGINTTGYVRVVRAGDDPPPGAPAARLILKPSSVTLNPAMAPAEYRTPAGRTACSSRSIRSARWSSTRAPSRTPGSGVGWTR